MAIKASEAWGYSEREKPLQAVGLLAGTLSCCVENGGMGHREIMDCRQQS